MLDEARQKLAELTALPRPWTEADRAKWWAAKSVVLNELFRQSPRKGFHQLLVHMGGTALAERRRHDRMEAGLRAELEQNHRAYEAIGRVVDRLSNELAVLKRDVELEKKLEVQRTKRRTEMLELENSLLRAGRRPDEAREEAEGELPGNFSEWNGHAQ